MFQYRYLALIPVILLYLSYQSCTNNHPATDEQIVGSPEEMDSKVGENIKQVIRYSIDHRGKINDTIKLSLVHIIDSFYQKNDFRNIWSKKEKWQPLSDSLYSFIESSESYGLYPSDYHYSELSFLRKLFSVDSLARADATLWTHAELMLTDAFMQIVKHLKQGRLIPDSNSLYADSTLANQFFIKTLEAVAEKGSLRQLFHSLEPRHQGYAELKKGIRNFTDSMDRKKYTFLNYPFKDSAGFIKNLKKRLQEGGYIGPSDKVDSLVMANGIKNFQKKKGLKVDGKVGPSVVKRLNATDLEKFKRIAINIDRYKLLPETLPEKFIWVNLPGYYLRVYDHDSLVFESKVIVGKPATRTPVLYAEISDMVIYPQWTIPNSIIKKDILPAMKRNIEYLTRKGFHLVDLKGDPVDPYTVNWAKYTKGIPYKIVQGSGDGNALGILKFNFDNPYSVYLHDTNERYLFKNASRALSHGCVRVQEWNKLAMFIAENDSLQSPGKTMAYTADSIKNWLAKKERRRIVVKNRMPLYIRYITCEGRNGKIIFHDDIYNEDKILRDKYFANK